MLYHIIFDFIRFLAGSLIIINDQLYMRLTGDVIFDLDIGLT
jgi:hypothetical protein